MLYFVIKVMKLTSFYFKITIYDTLWHSSFNHNYFFFFSFEGFTRVGCGGEGYEVDLLVRGKGIAKYESSDNKFYELTFISK